MKKESAAKLQNLIKDRWFTAEEFSLITGYSWGAYYKSYEFVSRDSERKCYYSAEQLAKEINELNEEYQEYSNCKPTIGPLFFDANGCYENKKVIEHQIIRVKERCYE